MSWSFPPHSRPSRTRPRTTRKPSRHSWRSASRGSRDSRRAELAAHAFNFDPAARPGDAPAFRKEIREFLARELTAVPAERRANCWAVFDADFTRKLRARGWIVL